MVSSFFSSIITEKFTNTLKDQSNYYLKQESKKECQEETTQNKAGEPQASLIASIKGEDKQKRNSRVEPLHSLAILWKR